MCAQDILMNSILKAITRVYENTLTLYFNLKSNDNLDNNLDNNLNNNIDDISPFAFTYLKQKDIRWINLFFNMIKNRVNHDNLGFSAIYEQLKTYKNINDDYLEYIFEELRCENGDVNLCICTLSENQMQIINDIVEKETKVSIFCEPSFDVRVKMIMYTIFKFNCLNKYTSVGKFYIIVSEKEIKFNNLDECFKDCLKGSFNEFNIIYNSGERSYKKPNILVITEDKLSEISNVLILMPLYEDKQITTSAIPQVDSIVIRFKKQ